jgi:hypothetical protein
VFVVTFARLFRGKALKVYAGRSSEQLLCIHCGVEVTELNTNQQHTISLDFVFTAKFQLEIRLTRKNAHGLPSRRRNGAPVSGPGTCAQRGPALPRPFGWSRELPVRWNIALFYREEQARWK